MTRRLLMIAHCFTPSLAVGRLRTLSFCKYLPRFGFQPVVLTRKLPRRFDPNLLKEIPSNTEVHRTGRGDLVANLVSIPGRLKRTLKNRNRSGVNRSVVASAPEAAHGAVDWKKLFFWPDEKATWVLAAKRKAFELARNCQVLYSSGPPITCHLVALQVAKLTGLPWIMDYRDPWMVDLSYPTRLQHQLFWRWERDCVRTCSRLINVNEPRTEAHREAFPNEAAEKLMTLPNGFDPEDFTDLPEPDSTGPMTISYLGSLYGGRSPAPVMRAIAQLWRSGQVKAEELRLQLIGDGSKRFVSLAEQLGIAEMIHVSRRLSYREGLAVLARSHVALFLGGSVDTRSTPTKIYEYFYLKKPTLAVLERGALWEVLTSAGVPCLTSEEEERIGLVLLSLLNDFRARRPLPQPAGLPDLNDHSRHVTARRLSETLDRLLTDQNP